MVNVDWSLLGLGAGLLVAMLVSPVFIYLRMRYQVEAKIDEMDNRLRSWQDRVDDRTDLIEEWLRTLIDEAGIEATSAKGKKGVRVLDEEEEEIGWTTSPAVGTDQPVTVRVDPLYIPFLGLRRLEIEIPSQLVASRSAQNVTLDISLSDLKYAIDEGVVESLGDPIETVFKNGGPSPQGGPPA